MIYPVAVAAILVVFIIVVSLMRKLQRRSSGSGEVGMSLDDVSTLKERGLLTEEESRRVRAALSRQVARQVLTSKTSGGVGSLLADPEVRRLEALAAEKAARKQSDEPDDEPSPGPAPAAPLPVSGAARDIASGGLPEPALPPDVLTMVEMGLITAEELEIIKSRAREKQAGKPEA